MSFQLILIDIDAGGGATIDLYYDSELKQVKEEKYLANSPTPITTYIDLDDFDAKLYGAQGQKFLDKISK